MKPRDKHQIFHMLFQFWSNRLFLQAYHKNMRTVTWRLEGSNCTHSHIIWKCPENNIIYIENNTQFEISLDSSRAELILCYSNPTEDIIYHHTKQRLMTKSNHKHSSPCSASSLKNFSLSCGTVPPPLTFLPVHKCNRNILQFCQFN